MAQRTVVQLEDDIDGGEASETISFGVDGALYEIDLNEDNAAALRDALAEFIDAARRTSSGTRRRSPRKSAPIPVVAPDSRAVRAWATAHGIAVSARGRIPATVLEQYAAAQ